MSRKVMRVPLDFDWPLNKVWKGYLYDGPSRPCPANCENGYTPAGRWLSVIVHLIMLAGSESVRDSRSHDLHPWLRNLSLAPDKWPTPDMRELTVGLAGRDQGIMGHDGIDRFVATNKIIEAAGLKGYSSEDDAQLGWGTCPTCKGAGGHPDDAAGIEAFFAIPREERDPPTGDGWQMWETTSEGSPMSPVFDTPEKLAVWLADTRASTFGSDTATYDQWLKMIVGPGWAPSAIGIPGVGVVSGVEAYSNKD